MAQQLLMDYEDNMYNTKNITKLPEETLKQIIAQQSKGNFNQESFHIIIRSIINSEDNKLKRLLYYFFECLDKNDKNFILCINHVLVDLSSPNEYVRGFVLRFISRIENYDYASYFIKGVKENLFHCNPYVRLNAVLCIGALGLRFDLAIEQEIINLMHRETVSEVLIVGFNTMHKLGMNFEEFLSISYPKDVLEVLSLKVDDYLFLTKLSSSDYISVAYNASCKLLTRISESTQELKDSKLEIVSRLLQILNESSDYKHSFIPYLKFVDCYSLEFLELVDAYDIEFSNAVIDVSFKNADTHSFRKIAELLFQKYLESQEESDKKKNLRILLLNKMATFASSHCVYINELIPICLKNIHDNDPELQFASLNFLQSSINSSEVALQIHSFLIENFSNLTYGKILRKIFTILCKNIKRENYEILLEVLLKNFNSDPIPHYLSNDPDVYIGAYICICLATMHQEEYGLKAKTISVMLKFIEHGTLLEIIDKSSKDTIITCVRSVLNGNNSNPVENEDALDYSYEHVLTPISFPLVKTNHLFEEFTMSDSISLKHKTVQMSGLGDPLYIESNVSYTKYEILLDMLIINQTSSYLRAITLDFSFSRNLRIMDSIESFSLTPNTATTINVRFSINESLNSFITADVSFKYPNKAEYNTKPYIQNLSEILIDINELLENADINFVEVWRTLEWEHIYSITMRRKIEDILDYLVTKVNGKLCNKLSNYGFIVANVACYTIRKTPVLINISISSAKDSLVEIRVRSKKEEIVKDVSSILSNYLKSLQ